MKSSNFGMDERKISRMIKADNGGDNELFAIFDNLGTDDGIRGDESQAIDVRFEDASFKIKPRKVVQSLGPDEIRNGLRGG